MGRNTRADPIAPIKVRVRVGHKTVPGRFRLILAIANDRRVNDAQLDFGACALLLTVKR